MHLYTLFLPAYTLDTADVGIEHVDNKRYTMRDIGRIEKRIETDRILYSTFIVRNVVTEFTNTRRKWF